MTRLDRWEERTGALVVLMLFALLAVLLWQIDRPAPMPMPTPPAPRPAPVRFAPVTFEPNVGQAAASVRYLSRGRRHAIEVFDDGVALSASPGSALTAAAQLRFLGASARGSFQAREPDGGLSNYLRGADPAQWLRGVAHYRQLRYAELYPGVDLVYYGRDGELEFDLVVKPGADPARIRLQVNGLRDPAIAANGDLLLDGPDGELRLHRPALYQNIDGERRALQGDFVMLGEREVGFELPRYDTRYPLVIDPVFKLLYSTYVGGVHDDQVGGMALDAQGNAYVIGNSGSEDWPVTGNAVQSRRKAIGSYVRNLVVTKFDSSGALLYSTFLGGSVNDYGTSIAVDASGAAYLTGYTMSPDFPVTAGAYQRSYNAPQSAFLAVLGPDGSSLSYSTFYSGSGGSSGSSVLLDANGKPVLVGAAGPGLPTFAGAYKPTLASGTAGFAARFDLAASGAAQLVAASYYGTDSPQANNALQGNTANAAVLAADGSVWFTGQAYTTNLPTTAGAVQAAPTGLDSVCAPGPGPLNSFAYVARLSADLHALSYASYLSGQTQPASGAACDEYGIGIALDAAGSVYVSGGTSSDRFPTTPGSAQPAFPSGSGRASYTGFVAKLAADGSAVLWGSYVGGNGGNTFPARALVADAAGGSVWLTTVSSGGANFPVTADALQPALAGASNATLNALDAATGALKYSSFLGGNGVDVGLALARDPSGNTYVAGATTSSNFPVTANALQHTLTANAYDGSDWFFAIVGQAAPGNMTPTHASNSGDANVTLRGAGFVAGTTCRLEGPATIASASANPAIDGTSIACMFALDGQPAGDYTLVAITPDGTQVRATQAFSVAGGNADPDVWANVSGRPKIRGGVPAPFDVTFGNRGGVNAYGVTMAISWPKGVTVKRKFEFAPLPVVDGTDPSIVVPEVYESGGRENLLLFIPVVGAGATYTLPLEITAAADAGAIQLGVSLSHPLGTSMDALRAAYMRPAETLSRALGVGSIRPRPLYSSGEGADCMGAMINAGVSAVQLFPPTRCIAASLGLVISAIQTVGFAAPGGIGASGNATNLGGLLLNMGQTVLTCAIAANPATALGATILGGASFALSATSAAGACGPVVAAAIGQIIAGTSVDPNDKTGPLGDGSPNHYVRAFKPATYVVSFENLATAALPAAQVVVTDLLDPAKFDLSSVTLGPIAWGAYRIDVPPGLNTYATVLDIDSTMSVRAQGSLDATTGQLKWTLTTIDPVTKLPPSDATLGFLPPDTDGARGQGHVTFSVAPRADLANGTVLQNAANVVFDANAPIVTPIWVNTLDATPPASHVQSVVAKGDGSSFDVTWAGSDTASGVASYAVYVSDNGAPFTLWQIGATTTTATYDGATANHSYAFYSIATDGAGNIEAAKTLGEASIVASATAASAPSSSGGGGGCTVGPIGQRDLALPLLLAAAFATWWVRRRYPRARVARANETR